MIRIFLLTTQHLEDGLWFRDEEDFKVAMNYVALEAARRPEVVVLAFILMSNHVHFVLKGAQEDVAAFLEAVKHRYSVYFQRKYGIKELLRRNELYVQPVPYDNEAAERAVAYVQMNSVAANICAFCNQYPWGTGSLIFQQEKADGVPLASLSARARKRMLHSNQDTPPGHWLIGKEGYILPQNYVDVAFIEQLYRTPKRMNYFLSTSSKARKKLEMNEDNLPAFRDQTLLAALPDLIRSLFQKDSFHQLSADEQEELARQLRFRFSADANQIARVCGLTYADAARLRDTA